MTKLRPGYRESEVGVIPENWDIRSFYSIVVIPSGQVDPKIDPYRSMVLIAPDHVESRTGRLLKILTAEEQGAISGKYQVEPGDVVYSKIRPNLCKAVHVDFQALCSADMYPLRTKPGVSSKYIHACIIDSRFTKYATSVSLRSGMPKINRGELASFVFSLPQQLPEQQAIAEALGDSDELIEALQGLIDKKRAIKLGAMQDLLTGHRRLPEFQDEWTTAAVGDLFDFGRTVPLSRAQLSPEGEVKYVHYGDIHTRLHNHLDFQRTPTPGADRLLCGSATHLEVGDWVFADASEDYDGVAKAVEITRLPMDKGAVAGLHTFVLREHGTAFAPGFKGYLANATAFRAQVMRAAVGMKVFGISKSQMKRIELNFPPTLDEQRAITAVLSEMDAEVAALETKLAKARAVKQGMIQVLLTGEIRLV